MSRRSQPPSPEGARDSALFRAARIRAGLSQSAAAAVLDVNVRTIQSWESSEWAPPKMALMAMEAKADQARTAS